MTKFITLLCAAIFAASCCNCKSLSKAYAQLDDHNWQLVEINGKTVTLAESDSYTLNFNKEDHKVAGRAVCNRYFATYSVGAKNYITFTGLGSTRMACPEVSDEGAYYEMLQAADGYKVDGDMLMLLKSGKNVATFKIVKKQ